MDIFGQVQGVLWTARGKCLRGQKGNGNEVLHAYVLRFWISGLWGVDVLRILGGGWRMASRPRLSQGKSWAMNQC